MISRRRFVVQAAALSVACKDKSDSATPAEDSAGPERAPERALEPLPWEAPGAEDLAAFPTGLQSGDATASSILLSLRAAVEAVDLVVVQQEGEGWVEVERREGLPLVDGGLQVELVGLSADTAWCYTFYAAGEERRGPVGRFRTALGDEGHRVLVFGATSCLGGNEPWPGLSLAAAERLDAMLLLGDTVYADGSVTLADYRVWWQAALATQGLRELCASTSAVATWDDHEVANNWLPAELADGQLEAALTAFRESIPARRGPGGMGLWRRLSWGPVCDLFVLDCRGERDGERYISEEQMAWLKAELLASTARFKLILNSVPITDLSAFVGDVLAEDRWQGYPEQRGEILSHIVDQGIRGVLWLAGDVHYGQIGMVDAAGGVAAEMWEVVCGPSGSLINAAAQLYVGNEQYPEMVTDWNWVRLELDPGLGTIRVQHIGDDGSVYTDWTWTA